MNDDRITEAMTDLIEAVSALGFERARDAISAYRNDPNEDASVWHAAFIDMIETAIGVAADASGEEGNDRWLALGPEPGFSIRWAWSGDATDDFAETITATVARALGRKVDV